MKIGSLFAGIGGFDLAARWMGWETAWVSEIDPYASAVLKKHWPNAPNLGDITMMNPPPVDMLVGGFPCQDISLAGKGAGITGERSGLWKHYARLIGEVRPRYVVIENSPRLRVLGLGVVLQDLFALGYDAEWHCIPASAFGAHHERDRVWIVAYPMCIGSPTRLAGSEPGQEGVTGIFDHRDSPQRSGAAGCGHVRWVPGQDGWEPEPAVGRVAHGVPSRVDRLRCLGNAIVPQVAYFIFQAIGAHEANRLRL